MDDVTAERVRAEMRDYMEREGLNITEFAKALKPDGPSARASVGKFLKGKQSALRGGMMVRFRSLQKQSKTVREDAYLGASPWPYLEEQIEHLLDLIRSDISIEDKKIGVQKVFGLHADIGEAHAAVARIEKAD